MKIKYRYKIKSKIELRNEFGDDYDYICSIKYNNIGHLLGKSLDTITLRPSIFMPTHLSIMEYSTNDNGDVNRTLRTMSEQGQVLRIYDFLVKKISIPVYKPSVLDYEV